MPSKFIICKSWASIKKVVRYCKQTGYCSHDFETTDTAFAKEEEVPTIIGISFQPGIAYIIPLAHRESVFKKNGEWKKILKYLSKELFENPKIVKIAWNLKFEHKWLMKYGCNYKGRIFDGMLAKYILDEERPNDLKSMVRKYLPEFSDYEDQVDIIANKLGWANVPIKILSKYCGLDCDLTLRLMLFFEKKLIKAGLYPLFRNLIMQASIVLAESEFEGMPVDVKYLDKLIKEYDEKIKENEFKLKNHKKLKRYERLKREENIQRLIENVKDEIEQIQREDKDNSERLVAAREEKISRYLAGEFTTNKEKAILEPFNFSSPNQVVDLFYDSKFGFKFQVVKYTIDKFKRETDRPSTDEEALLKLKEKDNSGFIDQLLTHRELTKLHSTYMVGIRKLVTPDNKVHANFKIHGTVTGRLSCGDPNLQNIPRDTTSSVIKKMFVAPKGYVIMQIDYSQAELRVIAEMANEKAMIEWFNTGKDIHLASACKKFNYSYDKALKIYENEKHPEFTLWKKRRKQAKTINFGIVYCQTANKLAGTLSEPAKDGKPAIIVTREEAQQFLNDFNRDFPAIIKFMESQRIAAKRQGYVRNLYGRKRRLPNIYSPVDGIRMEAERQAVNAPVQGSASDFALFSSVLIREAKDPKWDLKQIYTVHDSLGFLIKKEYIHEAVPILNAICENPQTQEWFGFSMKKVRMGVDFEIGNNWGGLKKYNKEINYIKEF